MASRKTTKGQRNRDEAELLNAAVEHIHNSSVRRADVAHWPNQGPVMDSECLAHVIPGPEGTHC